MLPSTSPLRRYVDLVNPDFQTLCASLKVPQAKLEAIEADRYQDLPDPTFVRALALAMCRALKVDPAAAIGG